MVWVEVECLAPCHVLLIPLHHPLQTHLHVLTQFARIYNRVDHSHAEIAGCKCMHTLIKQTHIRNQANHLFVIFLNFNFAEYVLQVVLYCSKSQIKIQFFQYDGLCQYYFPQGLCPFMQPWRVYFTILHRHE